MDDTKKLIEKYKRELMEMSKSAPKADLKQRSEPPKKQPHIIGYVENETRIPDEYENLLSEISDIEVDKTSAPEESGEQQAEDASEEPAVPVAAAVDEEMRQGSRGEPANFTEPIYDDYDQFTAANTGLGTISFNVFTAREAIPIEGAKCVLSKKIGGKDYEISSQITDSSGQTTPESLPAPSGELSQLAENTVQPFALYDATVTMDGFADVILTDIPIFDGIRSIQRVEMIPAVSGSVESIEEVPNADE